MTTSYIIPFQFTKAGSAAAPSVAPTVTVVDQANNVLVSAGTALTQLSALNTGAYVYVYSGADGLVVLGTAVTTDLTMDAPLLSAVGTKVSSGQTGDAYAEAVLIYNIIKSGGGGDAAAIKTITDQFRFTVANQVDANALSGGGGATAAQVWAYATRTLTQGAASVISAVTGTSISVYDATDINFTLTGLTDFTGYTKLWFTAKNDMRDADSKALLQLVVSNAPVPATDGLLVLQGGAQTNTNGSITVLSTTSIQVKVKAVAAQNLIPTSYPASYDVKALVSGNVVPISEGGSFTITGVVTGAVS